MVNFFILQPVSICENLLNRAERADKTLYLF